MSTLLLLYTCWLIISFVIIIVVIPRFVDEQYRSISIHITTLGFVIISLFSKFFNKVYNGTLTFMFMIVFLLSLTIFTLLISGAYYWIPLYYKEGDDSPQADAALNMIIGAFTVSLIFVNLYEQEYEDTIYKVGDTIAMIAGRRKLKTR